MPRYGKRLEQYVFFYTYLLYLHLCAIRLCHVNDEAATTGTNTNTNTNTSTNIIQADTSS